jgi:hypothetical protein
MRLFYLELKADESLVFPHWLPNSTQGVPFIDSVKLPA